MVPPVVVARGDGLRQAALMQQTAMQ